MGGRDMGNASGAQGHAGRDRERARLVSAVVDLGFPEEFGLVLAVELGGEASMRRMASYLEGVRPSRPEDVADELVAILADRERWVGRRMSEHANASLTAFYNRPGRPRS